MQVETVELPAGRFVIGDPSAIARDERAVKMALSKPTHIMPYLVTQKLWREIMGTEPWKIVQIERGFRQGDNFPVVGVTRKDACDFAHRLSIRTGIRYRLPTEVEWEYAIRAGTITKYFWGNNVSEAHVYAWCWDGKVDSAATHLHEVGELLPNAWGLYDMAGNVCEWVLDLCTPEANSSNISQAHFRENSVDFVSSSGTRGIIRNGAYNCLVSGSRCSARDHEDVNARKVGTGFRLVSDASHSIPVESIALKSEAQSENYLPLYVLWEMVEESDLKDSINHIWEYLQQMDALQSAKEINSDSALIRDQMKEHSNLRRLLRRAKVILDLSADTYKEEFAMAEVNRLIKAIAAIKELLK